MRAVLFALVAAVAVFLVRGVYLLYRKEREAEERMTRTRRQFIVIHRTDDEPDPGPSDPSDEAPPGANSFRVLKREERVGWCHTTGRLRSECRCQRH